MLKFIDQSGNEITTIKIQPEKQRLVRFKGAVVNSDTDKKKLSVKANNITAKLRSGVYDGKSGTWNVDITAGKIPGNKKIVKAQVIAIYKEDEATLNIEIQGPVIQLEKVNGINTAALFENLFLAECRNPGRSGYSLQQAKYSMAQMRMIVANRVALSNQLLKEKSKRIAMVKFLAKDPGTLGKFNEFHIIKGPGQFHGFESYPAHFKEPYSTTGGRVRDLVLAANNFESTKQKLYLAYVKTAKEIASMPLKKLLDAKEYSTLPRDLYAWRTAGSNGPGAGFELYQTYGGIDWYKLKE